MALAAHFILFGLVEISPTFTVLSDGGIDITNIGKHTKPIAAPERDKIEKPPKPLVQEQKPSPAVIPETIMVIPVSANHQPKWIVELLDIPKEKEPDEARFVSERPSSVEEEVQAEITSRKPHQKKTAKKKKTARRKKRPHKSTKKIVAKRKRRPARRSKLEPGIVTAPTIKKKSGVETEGPGNLPVMEGERDIARKPTTNLKTSDLVPTFGELAMETRPGKRGEAAIPGDPGAVEAPRRHVPKEAPGEDVPGVAPAPENFFPSFVKKRGNITMLNARSYKYSSFVRRVARRMFDRFVVGFSPRAYKNANWPRIQRGAKLEALMSANGRLVKLKVSRSAGDGRFDSLVKSAVRKEAWDSNVPPGAECSDGLVHFIFIPRIIPSQPVDSYGVRVYTRFLLLATAGLKDCQ